MTMREEFEAHMAGLGGGDWELMKTHRGVYMDPASKTGWLAWKAAYAAGLQAGRQQMAQEAAECQSIHRELWRVTPLADAKKHIKAVQAELDAFEADLCRVHGHQKGGRAWTGISYCTTCGGQFSNDEFRKPAAIRALATQGEAT